MGTLVGFGSLANIPEEKITDSITRRVLSGEKCMMVSWNIKSGTHAAAHSHPHEQIVWMIKGKCEARVSTERRILNAGDVAVIAGGVEHELWFQEDTELVDIFAPPREDFLAGGEPTWLQKENR